MHRLGLTLGPRGRERDPLPVRRAQQRPLHRDRLAQAVAQHGQTGHPELGKVPQHLTRHVAGDNSSLQRVVVDQHRGGEGLEAVDAQGVEDPGAHPGHVRLARLDVMHDLLLECRLVVSPPVDDLDPDVATGELPDPPDEVSDRGLHLQRSFVIAAGHRQDDRLATAACLVPAACAAGAARGHESSEQEDRRDPAANIHGDLVNGKLAYDAGPIGGIAP